MQVGGKASARAPGQRNLMLIMNGWLLQGSGNCTALKLHKHNFRGRKGKCEL